MAHPECTKRAKRNQDERQKSADLAFQAPVSLIVHGNTPKNEPIFKMEENLASTQEPYFLMVSIELVNDCTRW